MAFVYHGGASGVGPIADAQLWSFHQIYSHLGTSVAGAGDVNGDGYADVIVGAPNIANGHISEGAAFVYHGGASGVDPVDDTTLESNQASAGLGWSVAGAGDVNGDGYADVIVGAPDFDDGQAGEGVAFVYHGNTAGRPVLARQFRMNGVTPVASWGLSYDRDVVILKLRATSPRGRERVKLQAEVCPAGRAFGSSVCVTQTAASWSAVPATAGGVTLSLPIVGLSAPELYHWRARLLYAPQTVTQAGISAPLKPQHGPWRRLLGQAEVNDFTPLNAIRLAWTSATGTVNEAGGSAGANMRVTTSDGAATVLGASGRYTSSNDTATAGSDYTAVNGSLTVPPNTSSGTVLGVTVPITNDIVDENNETFTLRLTSPLGAVVGTPASHGVTIVDNDTATLTINNVTVAEGNSGTTAVTFTVSLSTLSAQPVTVRYATANGSALAGSDYTAVPLTTLTFAPGQTSKVVPVNVVGNTVREPNETFGVNLSGAVGATIFDSQGVGTILNDDGPVLRITDVSKAEGNAGTTPFTFTVTLGPASAQPVTVRYATANGSALAGSDYTAVPLTTLTFAPGQTSKVVLVNVVGNTVREPNETFGVNLSGAVGATIFDSQGVGTITNDD